MGVDLDLLPFDADRDNLHFSHTVLSCERRRGLWSEIEELVCQPVPEDFTCYFSKVPDGSYKGENCYGKVNETPYGDLLKYTTVKELLKLEMCETVQNNIKNKAIWAYLKCLPPETKVALYWH